MSEPYGVVAPLKDLATAVVFGVIAGVLIALAAVHSIPEEDR